MVFDWYLTLQVIVDENTGMPYIFHSNGVDVERKSYIPEEWRLPEKYRQFAYMRGYHMRHYTREIEDGEFRHDADVSTLFHRCPKWDDIQDILDGYGEDYDHDWNEDKHNLFRECLKWCAEKGGYNAEWQWSAD